MKRLLLVLMLLCVFIPENAKGRAMPPLVYQMKEADTGMDSSDSGSSWEKYKDNYTGYIIIEPNDNNTASAWSIHTWKAKDPNGKMQNYYAQQDMITFGFLQVIVGKNTVWIITYADDEQSIMMSGAVKPVKVVTLLGPATLSLAGTITGTSIWFDDENSYKDIASGKVSLSYNSPLTTYIYNNIDTGEDAVAYVISYLTSLHYLPGTD